MEMKYGIIIGHATDDGDFLISPDEVLHMIERL